MDENSCESETSKGVDNGEDGQITKAKESAPELENKRVRVAVGGKANEEEISDSCVPFYDASGPSEDFVKLKRDDDNVENPEPKANVKLTKASITNYKIEEASTEFSQPSLLVIIDEQPTAQFLIPIVLDENPSERPLKPGASEEQISRRASPTVVGDRLPVRPPSPQVSQSEQQIQQRATPVGENCSVVRICSNYEDRSDFQTRVRVASGAKGNRTTRKTSIGPPPSYSFVMEQKKKLKSVPSPDPLVTDRPPPPSYAGTRGLFLTPQESRLERICNFPSFVEPSWRSCSQPALCPRCGVIVLTTTHSHDSVATHVAALALCLFGCWPCCLLPYCMNACKNTYHHCPVCQAFLGLYTPW